MGDGESLMRMLGVHIEKRARWVASQETSYSLGLPTVGAASSLTGYDDWWGRNSRRRLEAVATGPLIKTHTREPLTPTAATYL